MNRTTETACLLQLAEDLVVEVEVEVEVEVDAVEVEMNIKHPQTILLFTH